MPGGDALPLPSLTAELPTRNVGKKRLPEGKEERFCFPTISLALVSRLRRDFREGIDALK